MQTQLQEGGLELSSLEGLHGFLVEGALMLG